MEMNKTVTQSTVTVRRSPRYGRFMIVGGGIFAIVAFILTYAFPQEADYDPAQVFGFLLILGVTVGVTLGGLLALVLDRATARRARTVIADRLDARATAGEITGPDAASDSPSSTQNPTHS